MIKEIYNLEFPSWCDSLSIFEYKFTRVEDYKNKILELQYLTESYSEFYKKINAGKNTVTAYVKIPENENNSVLGWTGDNDIALMDVLLILSILTQRDVFVGNSINSSVEKKYLDVLRDPRTFPWGGIIRISIPYEEKMNDLRGFRFDFGFEKGINEIYNLIRSDDWQKQYHGGYFLILAKMAFSRQSIESTFMQCWTIWEHLFAVLNKNWLLSSEINNMYASQKISFLFVHFNIKNEVGSEINRRIKDLVKVRNKLVHSGRFPDRNSAYSEAILFIRLTEYILAKVINLSPSNALNTKEELERYLNKAEPYNFS